MATEWASESIEKRVTAWHEAGHLISIVISRHFDVNDPAVDFRSGPRGKAFAGAKKLSGSAPLTPEEARELYAINLAGRLAEETLTLWSQGEGRTIYPDEVGAKADLAMTEGIIAHHQFDADQIQEETRYQFTEHLEVLVAVGDRLWKWGAETVSRAEFLSLPEIAALARSHPKAAISPPASASAPDVGGEATDPEPTQELSSTRPRPYPPAHAEKKGFWAWLRQLLGFR